MFVLLLTHPRGLQVKRDYCKNRTWIVGLVLIIIGSAADFAALAFGAQSIIAPLGSLTLVSNVFFAPCLLGETLTQRDIFSTAAIVAGATLAIIFASHKDTIYGYVDCEWRVPPPPAAARMLGADWTPCSVSTSNPASASTPSSSWL